MFIANVAVAEAYIALIRSLGVDISLTKSVTPSVHKGAEFASKLFADGLEYSPLPLGLVIEGRVERLFSLWTDVLTRSLTGPQDQT